MIDRRVYVFGLTAGRILTETRIGLIRCVPGVCLVDVVRRADARVASGERGSPGRWLKGASGRIEFYSRFYACDDCHDVDEERSPGRTGTLKMLRANDSVAIIVNS